MTSPAVTPQLLDATVLHELACGDAGTIALIQSFDAAEQTMLLSTIATTGTLADVRSDEAVHAMRGLEALEHVMVAPLRDINQAVRFADVIAKASLTVWDAHVAAVADASTCPILTYDAERWRTASDELDQPLFVIEIADSGE